MKQKRTPAVLGCAVLAVAVAAGVGLWLRPVSFFNGFLYLKEAVTGAESRSVTLAGHRMHYVAEGPANGPAVVLVHGLGGRAEDWLNLAPYLTKAGFRVYMPDLFGFGRSERPSDFSYSVRDQAAAVVGFIDALGLKQVDLCGWSMGGWIVQIVADTHPERVSRLVLIDSAGIYWRPDWDTNLFTPKTPAELDELETLLTPHPATIPGFVARNIILVSDRRAWIVHRALDTMMTGQDTTDKLLPDLKMPVLILWGKEDHITPLSLGQRMHELVPQSEIDIFEGCGHLAPEQCTGEMGPKLAGFVKK